MATAKRRRRRDSALSEGDRTRASKSPFGRPQGGPIPNVETTQVVGQGGPVEIPVTHSTLASDGLPTLGRHFDEVTERLFDSVGDPRESYKKLEEDISLKKALTPAVLQQALNVAEDNARAAHAMYVVGRAEFTMFEAEMDAVTEGMRAAATATLQEEKDKKLRSKAITDADVRGLAATMFPDEWKRAVERRAKGDAMIDHLKRLADLWQNRCYSVSSMLNAGKRS